MIKSLSTAGVPEQFRHVAQHGSVELLLGTRLFPVVLPDEGRAGTSR